MIIFLYGPDDYRREEKRKGLIAEFKKKHSHLGLGHFDLGESDGLAAFENFVKSQSIFEPVKLAVLENVLEGESGAAAILETLLEPKSVVVLASEREKPPKELEFLIRKPALGQRFDYLRGSEWQAFVAREAEKAGVKLADSALRFLGEAYEGDTWRLITELQKIALLRQSVIQKKDLEGLGIELAPDFWELLQGLKAGGMRERLTALEKLLDSNEPTPKIFSVLAYQWPEKLQEMAGYDLTVKSGKLDYEEALLDLVIS